MARIRLEQMTPTQKVAALLITLGPNTASEIMKNITDDNVLEQITIEITGLSKLPQEIIEAVVDEFHTVFQASSMLSSGGMSYAKELLEKAYGSAEADNILNRLVTILNSNPFQFLNEADPVQLATSFQNETPQLIALILAYLKPEQSAKILNCFPPGIQHKVSLKIAQMGTTNPEILAELEKIVESKFSTVVASDFTKAGGTKALADILNSSDRSTEKNVIEMMELETPELAENVRNLMFVFEDIVLLDDSSIQKVLREVDSKDLAMSLKGAREDVKEKILKNMSERAQGILLEDIEYMGPIRAKEVQKVQSKIVGIVKALEAVGEITISRGNQEDELIE